MHAYETRPDSNLSARNYIIKFKKPKNCSNDFILISMSIRENIDTVFPAPQPRSFFEKETSTLWGFISPPPDCFHETIKLYISMLPINIVMSTIFSKIIGVFFIADTTNSVKCHFHSYVTFHLNVSHISSAHF
jgi:hypothetical protein